MSLNCNGKMTAATFKFCCNGKILFGQLNFSFWGLFAAFPKILGQWRDQKTKEHSISKKIQWVCSSIIHILQAYLTGILFNCNRLLFLSIFYNLFLLKFSQKEDKLHELYIQISPFCELFLQLWQMGNQSYEHY